MKTRVDIAVKNKTEKNYNCAQAVATAYADLMGVDEQTALNMTAAFGVGMGNMEGTCGALTGAGVVIGMITKDKGEARKKMKVVMDKFQKRNHVTQCKYLKGLSTGVVLRECKDCVADACTFLESALADKM